MSSKEIMAVLIPTGILALVWVIFESSVLKVVKKKGKSSDNKGKAEINLKKQNSTDSIDSNIETGKEIVESKQAFQKTQSAVIENKDLKPDAEKEDHMVEEEFYELAYEEIESGNLKKGLWAKSFSEAEGDENKAKALYIKYRFDQIKEGHKKIKQEEEEVKIDSKLESEKRTIEPKIESHDEFANRHKGQSKLSQEDIDRKQAEAYIKLHEAINYWE
jgi:hypothetical protein